MPVIDMRTIGEGAVEVGAVLMKRGVDHTVLETLAVAGVSSLSGRTIFILIANAGWIFAPQRVCERNDFNDPITCPGRERASPRRMEPFRSPIPLIQYRIPDGQGGGAGMPRAPN
ncbi:hypothetical protein Cob_v001292 [Colletotrichum orbiculare MAFF 240422]|uniref:Uncharacterized protein n=1 Tax=Colletotrichum orbiculare (strain 104-T / ATCC 96160 / CBS 514.97 / LARS 414 / MAFF 240422) TaxID=1213857 RepID=A0A484G8D8_COLOR|nr:hypothetical protein Cob_v001292 [Colletotrichum orbiculare MAFF 240422]